MYEDLKTLSDKLQEAKKEVAKKGEKAVKAAFKELFDKYPKILEVRWEQFTPYFNDGDACEFSVNGWYVMTEETAGEKMDDGADADDGDCVYDDPRYTEEYSVKDAKMKSDIQKIFDLAGEEAMELTFGDHAEVRATRKGFQVEECSHD